MQTQRQKDASIIRKMQKKKQYRKPTKRQECKTITKEILKSYKEVSQLTVISKANLYASQLRENPTPEEKIMIEILDFHHIFYEFQKIIGKGNSFYIVDFWIPTNTYPLVLEADGYAHYTENGKKRDSYRTKLLKIWTKCQILKFSNSMIRKEPTKVGEFIVFKISSLKN